MTVVVGKQTCISSLLYFWKNILLFYCYNWLFECKYIGREVAWSFDVSICVSEHFAFYSEGLGLEFNRVFEMLISYCLGEILGFVMLIPSIDFLVEIMVALLKNRWCVCMVIKAFRLMVLSCRLLVSVCVCVCVFGYSILTWLKIKFKAVRNCNLQVFFLKRWI